MTEKQPPEALRQAAWLKREGASCQRHYDLGVLIERQHGELETLRAKLKTYEDLDGAASDVQLLRMGYAAARLEIESLRKEHADELAVAYMCGASRDKELAAQQPGASRKAPASSAVLKAIRDANMQLVRTGDDAFMLVPYQQAHVQNHAEIEHVAGYVSKNGAELNMSAQQPAPASQQEAQEPVAWYVTGCGQLLDEDEAKAEARHIGGTAMAIPVYTAPQPSPAAQGDALSDAVRVPLDSLHADAAYLIGRLREGSMPYARVIEIIRERIDAAKAAIRARAANGDIPDVVDVPDQCPYFGPSPHRDVWLAGWYAARAAQEGKSNDR